MQSQWSDDAADALVRRYAAQGVNRDLALRVYTSRLLGRDTLSDEDMVNFQRTNLIDAGAPNPSVETLLHAFLPHKFIDHTHSTAVLALADQPDCAEVCRAIYGRRM